MTARAVLWHHRPRKNGRCTIKIYTYIDGKKTYTSTPHNIRPEDWDTEKGRMKPTAPLAGRINPILTRLENEALGELMGFTSSLLRLVELYIDECKAGKHSIGESTWKQYCTHLDHLKGYALNRNKGDITFSEIDMEFYRNFIAYLMENGCGRAGAGKHIKHLKKFMRIGLDRDLHNNRKFNHKDFVAERIVPTDNIYLSHDEIARIADLNLSDRPDLVKERDRFLVSYYLLLRYGDSVEIKRSNVVKHGELQFYRNVAEKTETVSFAPIKPAAIAILERYDYDFSGSSNQEANRRLKTIATMAGIIDNQALPGEPYASKALLVTTHTARRSAATNMLLDGLPVPQIMQAGGWKKESTFRNYILASGIELAQLSSSYSFFQ